MNSSPLLEVRELRVHYTRGTSQLAAVDDVTFTIANGESVALIGESGSGKTSLARAIVGMVPVTAGTIQYAGHRLGRSRGKRRWPWTEVQLVFQDPGGSLDPRMRIGAALSEVIRLYRHRHGPDSNEAVVERLLALVGLPADAAAQPPTKLSGGQKQRAAIALALAAQPKLLVCDEAVSALDVSIRAQILQLLSQLKRELGLSFLFITHDLHVARQISDRLLIMYDGQIVESGETKAVLGGPRHPYTQLLVSSIPSIDHSGEPLPDLGPAAAAPVDDGCVFAHRCCFATEESRSTRPLLIDDGSGHATACHNWRSLPDHAPTIHQPYERDDHDQTAITGAQK